MLHDKKKPDVHPLHGVMTPLQQRFGLRIIAASSSFAPPDGFSSCPERYFEFYSLSQLTGGGGKLEISGGETVDLSPGDAVLIAPGTINRYGGANGLPYCEDAVCFTGPAADRLYHSGVITDGVYRLGTARQLLPIIELAQDPSEDATLEAGMTLIELLFQLRRSRRNSSGTPSPLMRLLAVLREKPEKWWTVSEMAEFCQLSDDQLRRQFLRHTGLRPKEYLENLKLRRAAQLLSEERLSVRETAGRLGYADPFHFSRRFKRVIGIPPGEYRRNFFATAAGRSPGSAAATPPEDSAQIFLQK